MKLLLMVFAMSLLLAFPSGLKAQIDSLVDVFPLAVGNEWTYRYFTLVVNWPAGNPFETRTDSGRVTYSVSGNVRNTDSTRWRFQLRRDLSRHQILYWPVFRDTTYPIRDSSLFELIENHQGQHQIYRIEDPGAIHLDVFPFTKDFTDTTLILRLRRVGLGDTVVFRSAFYSGYPRPYVRSIFTFKKNLGLLRFKYNSGSMDVFDSAYHYLLTSVITSAGETTTENLPERPCLFQNYPNPFNPTTTIRYTLSSQERDGVRSQHVTLRIFDLLGREVATLVNEEQQSGTHTVAWDASSQPSGIYFYRLNGGLSAETKKMLLIR